MGFGGRWSFVSKFLVCLGVALVVPSCRSRGDQPGGGAEVQEFFNRNLVGADFDLRPNEYVLTFDDGPGPDTARLVSFLEQRRIPAVFFLVGSKVQSFPDVVRRIAANPDLFYVANHSMTHTDPLTTSTSFAIQEINQADQVIRRITEPRLKFMRPPYGALVGSVARIQGINAFSPALASYIGPIFWDVGGELTSTHSADWACWGSVSIERCQAGYIREMADRGRGVVLLHDIHRSTVDMVTRAGGLVDTMAARNFRIVNIAPAARVAELAARFRAVPNEPGRVDKPVLFAVANEGVQDGKRVVAFTISSEGATRFEIGFDRTDLKIEKEGPVASFTFPFANPGSRVISVIARFADGTFTRASQSFTVAAPVAVAGVAAGGGMGLVGTAPDAASAQMPPDVSSFNQCFDVAKMSQGRTFDLFNGEGTLSEPQTSSKVTKSKLTLVAAPVAIAAETWLVRYRRQAEDGVEESYRIALSTRTGCIVDGVRMRKTSEGVEESFVRGKFIDCANKVWRGEIITPTMQSNDAVMKVFGKAPGQSAAEKVKTEWFTFHADEGDDAEPINAGPGVNAGEVCADH